MLTSMLSDEDNSILALNGLSKKNLLPHINMQLLIY